MFLINNLEGVNAIWVEWLQMWNITAEQRIKACYSSYNRDDPSEIILMRFIPSNLI